MVGQVNEVANNVSKSKRHAALLLYSQCMSTQERLQRVSLSQHRGEKRMKEILIVNLPFGNLSLIFIAEVVESKSTNVHLLNAERGPRINYM